MDSRFRSLVPMAHVRNLGDSIAFYRKLGFEARNTFVPEGQTDPTWAWLEVGAARLMLALADEPVVPDTLRGESSGSRTRTGMPSW